MSHGLPLQMTNVFFRHFLIFSYCVPRSIWLWLSANPEARSEIFSFREEEKLPHGFILTTVCLYSFLLLDSAFTIKLRDGCNGYFIPIVFPEVEGAGEHRHSSRWQLPVSPQPCQELSLETGERKREVLWRMRLPSLIDLSSLREKKWKKNNSLETNLLNGDD